MPNPHAEQTENHASRGAVPRLGIPSLRSVHNCCTTEELQVTPNEDIDGPKLEKMIQHVTNLVGVVNAQQRELQDQISDQMSKLCVALGVQQPHSVKDVHALRSLARCESLFYNGPSPRGQPSDMEYSTGAEGSPLVSRIKNHRSALKNSSVASGSTANEVKDVHATVKDGAVEIEIESPPRPASIRTEGTIESPHQGRSDLSSPVSNSSSAKKSKFSVNSQVLCNLHFSSPEIDMLRDESEVEEVPPFSEGVRPWLTAQSKRLVHSGRFDETIGIIILMNAITIGWETQKEIHGDAPLFLVVLENTFLVMYIMEIIVRLFAFTPLGAMKQPWVVFDVFLVLLGCFSSWLVEPLVSAKVFESNSIGIIKPILVLRVLRLLRLLRALRLIHAFKYLWRLVQGLLHCVPTMASAGLLLCGTIYIFSCVSVEIVTKNQRLLDDPEVGKIVKDHFASLPLTMLTLFQFATLDSIASIYMPIIKLQPDLFLFFLPIMLVVSIALMNLVTAVLVEASIDNGKVDKEMQKAHMRRVTRKLEPQIQEAFEALDTSGDGTITKHEVAQCSRELPDILARLVKPESLQELFDMLDMDGSGKVESEEFVNGVLHLAMSDVSIETQQTLKLLRIIRRETSDTDRRLKKIELFLTRRPGDGEEKWNS